MENPTPLIKIKPGDIVCLTDQQTITDLISEKVENATDGLKAEVRRVFKIVSDFCTWYLCELNSTVKSPHFENLYLGIAQIDDMIDIGVYYVDKSLPVGNRRTLLEQNANWLFCKPDDITNFKPSELRYTDEITYDIGDKKLVFQTIAEEIHGESLETPVPKGEVQPQMATVVEYKAVNTEEFEDQSLVSNPLILVFERGGVDDNGIGSQDGGVITYYQGAPISIGDIDLYSI